jgi:hypothetical protein
MEQKTAQFGGYLTGRTGGLDSSEPSPSLRRIDDREVRKRTLSLSQSEAKQLGIERSALHSFRGKAKNGHGYRIMRGHERSCTATALRR